MFWGRAIPIQVENVPFFTACSSLLYGTLAENLVFNNQSNSISEKQQDMKRTLWMSLVKICPMHRLWYGLLVKFTREIPILYMNRYMIPEMNMIWIPATKYGNIAPLSVCRMSTICNCKFHVWCVQILSETGVALMRFNTSWYWIQRKTKADYKTEFAPTRGTSYLTCNIDPCDAYT